MKTADSTPPALDTKEVHRTALKIMELMHGMPVAQADHLMSEVKRLLHMTTFVDVTSAAHSELVQSYNQQFGEDVSAQRRQ